MTLREALGIGHRALPACAETLGVTAGAPQRMARLPTLPHCRISKLANCFFHAFRREKKLSFLGKKMLKILVCIKYFYYLYHNIYIGNLKIKTCQRTKK